MKTIYITTPIYYSSGKPHIGHAYSTIMADVIGKYYEILGYEVFFVTGMDEHGQKIADKASENKITPQKLIDENAKIFKETWKKLKINENFFIRTSMEKHKDFVQKIFKILWQKNYLYKANWKTKYCVSCEENIRDINVIKKNEMDYCIHGHQLTTKEEETYFLKVTLFKEWLIDYYKKNANFIYPSSRIKELVNNFLNDDFEDLSVTRTNLDWGIRFLEDENHVIYVWVDALLSYLSALEINDKLKNFWNQETKKVHLMSKEITRFHCIYWPILLKMLDYELPNQILPHGWIVIKNKLNNENVKMSKSLNNVIDPIELLEIYDSDVIRYFLMKSINVTSDSFFDHSILDSVYNSDLANNFGNIVSRTIGMIQKYYGGLVPNFKKFENEINREFKLNIKKNWKELIEKIEICDVNQIVLVIDNFANLINVFIEESKPWNYYKNQEANKLEEFLVILYWAVKIYVYSLKPILSNGFEKAKKQLNFQEKSLNIEKIFNFEINNNVKVNQAEQIFARKK